MLDNKKKILIVDDEEDLTWSLSRKLSKDNTNLSIFCANSGNSALEILEKMHIDLIVTDLRMPGLNGLQLLNEIRAKHPLMQVMVMTAYGSPEVRQALQRWGGTEYIEKPFEINDFKSKVYHLLDQSV